MMKKQKLEVGDTVKAAEGKTVRIKEIEKHGKGVCGCCDGEVYFMCRLSTNLWINERHLEKVTVH
jgi:hypothetical protein